MEKMEVLVDTVFLQKLSKDGKNIVAFKKVLSELDFKPIVHPYIATNELDMFPYFEELVKEQYIRVAEYNEFLRDDYDKELYSTYFLDMHTELRKFLDDYGGRKKLEKLVLPHQQTIFEYRKAGMSLGDVHMVLMASFAQIPVILSEDADIDVLKGIAKKRISYSGFELTILGCVEVLEKVALLENTIFTKKELVGILMDAGENKKKSVINSAWNQSHNESFT